MTNYKKAIVECPSDDQSESSISESSMAITMDVGFHLLQNSRRRAVFRYLLDVTDDIVTISEIAEQVAAWETETTVPRVSEEARKRVYIALYQIHLPKLAEADVIEYNRDQGFLAATPLVDIFAPYLDEEVHPDNMLTLESGWSPDEQND